MVLDDVSLKLSLFANQAMFHSLTYNLIAHILVIHRFTCKIFRTEGSLWTDVSQVNAVNTTEDSNTYISV